MLPNTKPAHALIQWHDRTKLPETISLDFEGIDDKTVFKLRIYDSKRATVERVMLSDYDSEKARYKTMLPAQFRDVEGIKAVRDICKQFTEAAHSITLRADYSSYNTDCYYI